MKVYPCCYIYNSLISLTGILIQYGAWANLWIVICITLRFISVKCSLIDLENTQRSMLLHDFSFFLNIKLALPSQPRASGGQLMQNMTRSLCHRIWKKCTTLQLFVFKKLILSTHTPPVSGDSLSIVDCVDWQNA